MNVNVFRLALGRTLRLIKDLPGIYQFYRWRTERMLAQDTQKIEDVFTHIHRENSWNNEESVSGIGSMKIHTQQLADELPGFCEKYTIRTFLDAPCGDFNWMRQVRFHPELKYTGGDIVEKVVQDNSTKYGGGQYSFIHLDIVNENLVKADVIFVRDCLVHLSYADIRGFLNNLVKSDIRYLLTTSFPLTRHNYNITTGNWRAINLQRSPFKFPEPVDTIQEKTTENKFQYVDKCMNLYRVSDLVDLDFLNGRS